MATKTLEERLSDRFANFEQLMADIRHQLLIRTRRRKEGGDPVWWSAIEIAEHLGISHELSRERRKRVVRELMTVYQDRRDDLIASYAPNGGYAIGMTAADFAAYQDARRRSGRAHLGAASRQAHSTVQDDVNGQLRVQEVGS
ncbi:MAG: hypothetical protein GC159_12740 [Phycisphaera sp.]|nr:hypothetical protein [Phycisphaera sp.]